MPIVKTIKIHGASTKGVSKYIKNKENNDDNGAYFFYIVQLILNFMWSFIFFTFRLYGLSFIWIIILFIFVVITFIKFIKIDKIAGFLLVPYMLWLVFAGILNFFVWVLMKCKLRCSIIK